MQNEETVVNCHNDSFYNIWDTLVRVKKFDFDLGNGWLTVVFISSF